jgi:hypothetical protein
MKILNKIFGTNKNPMLTMLEKSMELKFKEVFYCFGFIYTKENLIRFKKHLELNSLEEAKKELLFDVTQDNLEIYFVTDLFGNKSIIVLIDYYEPLQKEKMLEQIPLKEFPNIEMKKLK